MVIGSQLQVSKLAQMAPSSAQRRSVAASSAQRWPAATSVKTRAKTRMEHLGAPPWSTKCPFKTFKTF